MMKFAKTVFYVILTMCLTFAFVGCSQKERKTVDINALVNVFNTNYAEFFDDNGDFDITYASSVQNLISNDEKVVLLESYFEPIAYFSYHFFNLTKASITDENWKKEFRIDIYNNLNDLSKSLQNFKYAKERLEMALDGYVSGNINNIQYSNLTNYIKEYGDFIGKMQKFQNDYVEAYFNNFATTFYAYNGQNNVSQNDVKILLAHKSFEIAKISYDLEFSNYYDLENAQFMQKVVSDNDNTTKLCKTLEILNSLESTIPSELVSAESKNAFKSLIDSQRAFNSQMKTFEEALDAFDYKKMRKSNETESAYVEQLDAKNKNVYNHIFYIAYDYISQVKNNFENAFNKF